MNQDELNEAERLFLSEVLRRSEIGEQVDMLQLRIDLRDQLPKDFSISRLDKFIQGNRLTAKALCLVDPGNQLLQDVNRMIRWLREQILKEPRPKQVQTTDVAAALGFTFDYVNRLLELSLQVAHYSNGWGVGSDNQIISLNVDGESAIGKLLSFDSLEAEIERQSKPVSQAQGFAWPGLSLDDDVVVTTLGVEAGTAFILMSMNPEEPELAEVCNAIKDVCRSFGIVARRVDDIRHSSRITDLILHNIETAEYIIADLSGERPNVYYEIGYAHALRKEPILFRRKSTKLHFDLSVHNAPEYSDVNELRKLLTLHLEEIVNSKSERTA